jgi:uncharacterized membrane protein
MNTTKIATVAILAALSIVTNYALSSIYNVKLMDLFTFVGGLLFGPVVGALVGVLSWSVYGALNPYGFVPQIWIATMLSEAVYGAVGGMLSRTRTDFSKHSFARVVFLANLGFLLTLAYDAVTNVVYAQVYGTNLLVAFVLGAPFTLTHEISNALLFGLCVIPLISAVQVIGVGNNVKVRG